MKLKRKFSGRYYRFHNSYKTKKEALNRVLPFTAKGDDRPVLACVLFVAKEGKLTLVSADGFRLAVVTLDYDDGEGQALVNRDELRGIANALRLVVVW